jgi:hypothetical protein
MLTKQAILSSKIMTGNKANTTIPGITRDVYGITMSYLMEN